MYLSHTGYGPAHNHHLSLHEGFFIISNDIQIAAIADFASLKVDYEYIKTV